MSPPALAQFGLWQPPDMGQVLPAPDLTQDALCDFLMMRFDEMDKSGGKHTHTSEFILARPAADANGRNITVGELNGVGQDGILRGMASHI